MLNKNFALNQTGADQSLLEYISQVVYLNEGLQNLGVILSDLRDTMMQICLHFARSLIFRLHVHNPVSNDKNADNRRSLAMKPAVQYLGRHDIDVTSSEISFPPNLSEADRLFGAVEKFGCNILLMGAYGHSRLKELILGGMPREALLHINIPVFMAH